jgi:hypothetical protein
VSGQSGISCEIVIAAITIIHLSSIGGANGATQRLDNDTAKPAGLRGTLPEVGQIQLIIK